jgi:hypothetical protein
MAEKRYPEVLQLSASQLQLARTGLFFPAFRDTPRVNRPPLRSHDCGRW